MKKIESIFNKMVVGQSSIVSNLQSNLAGWIASDGRTPLVSPFFDGAAGLGKTQLLRAWQAAFGAACEERGLAPTTIFYSSPAEFRTAGEEFGQVMEYHSDTTFRPLSVVVDEVHEFRDRKTVQTEKIYRGHKTFLGNSKPGSIESVDVRIDDDTTWMLSKGSFSVAYATNFVQKLPDKEAIHSRFNVFKLANLTVEELARILVLMLDGVGIRACEETMKIVSRCGRGTARPMQRITEKFVELAAIAGKGTVNKADALQAMRDLAIYPQGVDAREIAIMQETARTGSMSPTEIRLAFNMEAKTVSESIHYLASVGLFKFINARASITGKGTEYLNGLRKAKFIN